MTSTTLHGVWKRPYESSMEIYMKFVLSGQMSAVSALKAKRLLESSAFYPSGQIMRQLRDKRIWKHE